MISEAMKICSRRVREFPCEKCRAFAQCSSDGCPRSFTGKYLSWLELSALPRLRVKCSGFFGVNVALHIRHLNEDEMDAGYIAVVSCSYKSRNGSKSGNICRVPLWGCENEIEVASKIFTAIDKHKGKFLRYVTEAI